MAILLKQNRSGNSGGYVNSFTITTLVGLMVGDTVFINLIQGNADTIASFSDNLSNTYTLDKSSANPTTGERQARLYRSSITTGGSPTITITNTAGQFPDSAWIGRVYSGLTTSPLDVTSSANDGAVSSTTHEAGTTLTTTEVYELVILFGGSSGSASPVFVAGTGYGNGVEQKGFDLYTYAFMSDKLAYVEGTQTGNFTSTGSVLGMGGIATYKGSPTSYITGITSITI